jgi:hypothetical protein
MERFTLTIFNLPAEGGTRYTTRIDFLSAMNKASALIRAGESNRVEVSTFNEIGNEVGRVVINREI